LHVIGPDEEMKGPSDRVSAPFEVHQSRRSTLPVVASRFAAVWAFAYALYRGYYALGGTVGMFGEPVSEDQWRFINAIGAGILLVGAAAPLVLLNRWSRPRLRPILLVFCWIVTVGCIMHALVDTVQRAASLAGLLSIHLPFWQSIDQRQSDLQDLLFNEPWFFVEGLAWGAIAWTGGLKSSRHRRWWIVSALAAIVALTIMGLLSAFGVTGRFIVG
jgi:hypothetical protein